MCVSGLHYGIILTAVLVAILIFALLAGATWFAYKRNALCFRGLPTLGSAYYRQTSTQSTESDGNVLITDLGAHSDNSTLWLPFLFCSPLICVYRSPFRQPVQIPHDTVKLWRWLLRTVVRQWQQTCLSLTWECVWRISVARYSYHLCKSL